MKIRIKLMLMIIGSTVSMLLLSGLAIYAYESMQARRAIVQDALSLARITASTSTAALAFHDQKSVNEYLSALSVRTDVTIACIYAEDRSVFGKFIKPGAKIDCPQPADDDGYAFRKGALWLFEPVRLENRRIGTLFLASDLRPLTEALRFHAELVGSVLLLAVLLTILISGRLHRYVSDPISELTETAREVSEKKDYSIRAKARTRDEIGELVATFNGMLEQIEEQNTKLENLLKEARAAVHMRDEFMSIASHELKTPLTSLRAQVQMLERLSKTGRLATAPPEQIDRLMRFTDQQVMRLVALIEDLLDVTRIATGRLHLHREKVEIAPLIREVLENERVEIEQSGSPIETHLEEHVIANCDHLRFEQVVVNLLTNALKYGRGRAIEIDVKVQNRLLCLSVRDHGIGISREAQCRIFGRFERAVSVTHYGGLGLGLYISKQIVVAHGGTIRVESEPGEGSNFIVELPLSA